MGSKIGVKQEPTRREREDEVFRQTLATTGRLYILHAFLAAVIVEVTDTGWLLGISLFCFFAIAFNRPIFIVLTRLYARRLAKLNAQTINLIRSVQNPAVTVEHDWSDLYSALDDIFSYDEAVNAPLPDHSLKHLAHEIEVAKALQKWLDWKSARLSESQKARLKQVQEDERELLLRGRDGVPGCVLRRHGALVLVKTIDHGNAKTGILWCPLCLSTVSREWATPIKI